MRAKRHAPIGFTFRLLSQHSHLAFRGTKAIWPMTVANRTSLKQSALKVIRLSTLSQSTGGRMQRGGLSAEHYMCHSSVQNKHLREPGDRLRLNSICEIRSNHVSTPHAMASAKDLAKFGCLFMLRNFESAYFDSHDYPTFLTAGPTQLHVLILCLSMLRKS
ncbi:hypothetical protein K491DRAFT_246517 [Lophiostoma macrostomum CBS 122681]|uniref:Uncharacterized protein n=1 Tax=Lophiostoma macrostomum CBS 122681 TaxID=1314788 RepID=A0A6A6TIL9_9PLEO|nr:hypothetical protein K491DRAFT_246517 [Lophiostoma macrostomum CBS 122681]